MEGNRKRQTDWVIRKPCGRQREKQGKPGNMETLGGRKKEKNADWIIWKPSVEGKGKRMQTG